MSKELPEQVITSINGTGVRTGFHVVLARSMYELSCAYYVIRNTVTDSRAVEPHNEWQYVEPEFCGRLHPTEARDTTKRLINEGRQFFACTMNRDVLDVMHFESADDVRERILFFRLNEDKTRGVGRMTAADAGRFFRAYSTGIQHVSEILLSEGLW